MADKQIEPFIQLSKHSHSEEFSEAEIEENKFKQFSFNEFKLDFNLNSMEIIKFLELPDFDLKLEKSSELSLKQEFEEINFQSFSFIELYGTLTNTNNYQYFDFKIICESTIESNINIYLFILILFRYNLLFMEF